jgi:6-pyruvoyltetrahydropterin/6-carboxytetrahydropterin synthase
MGYYRIAKTFEVEYGHRLHKHPEKCRFLHGHRLRIEVVVRGRALDDHDMVCDYKALKMLVADLVGRLDHAMALSSDDPELGRLSAIGERVLLFPGQDPTTEVLAKWLFDEISLRLQPGRVVESPGGGAYRIPEGLTLERVRVWETSTSWAEYLGAD